MSRLGEFEQVVLFSVLRLQDAAYGLAIRDSIKERTGRTVSPGAIYTTLGRLEGRGLVSSRIGDPPPDPEGGRPRKLYELRPPGARALLEAYSSTQALAEGLLPALGALAER